MVRRGHPWVYEASVREQNRPGKMGELAVIYDKRDRFLAVGLYDSESIIRVRVLHTGKPAVIDAAWFGARLAATFERRAGLFDASTNGYRLVNGEGDGWPGLVMDKFAETLVIKLYTCAWLPHLTELTRLAQLLCSPVCVVLRMSRNMQASAARLFGARDGSVIAGRLESNPVCFLENGIRFEADALKGQKTGFFLDQRENRRMTGRLASGKSVLNAFSFSGGFSLYAARGGARHVTDLDISPHALESSRRNWKLNEGLPGVISCGREWVQGDTFDWLGQNAGKRYDLIILDPPSFAKKESDREGAIRAYTRLARLGASRLEPKGMLVCCSCSAHVRDSEFFEACAQGAGAEGGFDEVSRTGHALDHPAGFREFTYLKALYLRRRA